VNRDLDERPPLAVITKRPRGDATSKTKRKKKKIEMSEREMRCCTPAYLCYSLLNSFALFSPSWVDVQAVRWIKATKGKMRRNLEK
jgi:hypothetical protein